LKHAQQYALAEYRAFVHRRNKILRYRYNNDVDYKLVLTIKRCVTQALKRVGKSDTGKLKYLGCTVTQLRQYFEYNHFQEEEKQWMNWKNWGGGRCHIKQSWELDHIMPVSSFDLSDEEEVKKINRWSNLQPLEWQANIQKYNSIPEDFEWCNIKERWLWSKASGKTNYELP